MNTTGRKNMLSPFIFDTDSMSRQDTSYYTFDIDALEFACSRLIFNTDDNGNELLDSYYHTFNHVGQDTYSAAEYAPRKVNVSKEYLLAGKKLANSIKEHYSQYLAVKKLSGQPLSPWEEKISPIIMGTQKIKMDDIGVLAKLPINFKYTKELQELSASFDIINESDLECWTTGENAHSPVYIFRNCEIIKKEKGFFKHESGCNILYVKTSTNNLIRCSTGRSNVTTNSLIDILISLNKPITIEFKCFDYVTLDNGSGYYAAGMPLFRI